jgi:hypothetical protein
MAAISESFYKSLLTITTVFTAGYFVNKSLTSTIQETIKPLAERVIALEKTGSSLNLKLSESVYKSNVNSMCLNSTIDFINKKFNKDFIKPEDIYYKTKEVSNLKDSE